MSQMLYAVCDCGNRCEVAEHRFGEETTCGACGSTFDVVEDRFHTLSTTLDKPELDLRTHRKIEIPAEWRPGEVYLGKYEVLEMVGRGGMGKVYRVLHRGWGIELAVKCPSREILEKRSGIARIEHECETWMKLGVHPHIVTCFYVRRLGAIPRIFAEYVDGGTLSFWIKKRKLYEGSEPEVLKRILKIAVQIAWGLDHAHVNGIAHCDVKPSNIMLTKGAVAKVTDFGLARVMRLLSEDSQSSATLEASGFSGLTPFFCSPEQAFDEEVTSKSDIWSFGLCVLQMFTVRVSWRYGTVAYAALERSVREPPGYKGVPRIPRRLAELLGRCFQDKPDRRPEDLSKVADRLMQIYEEETGEKFPYEKPSNVAATPPVLNNQAVSFFDMGKTKKSIRLLEKAHDVAPNYLQSTFNLSLLKWRAGEITDIAFVETLQDLVQFYHDDSLPLLLLAYVHHERGDIENCLNLLDRLDPDTKSPKSVDLLRRASQELSGQSRDLQMTFEGHADSVTCIAVSPHGDLVASGSKDNSIRLWNLKSGEQVALFDVHRASLRCILIDREGKYLLSCASEETVKLSLLASGQCIHETHFASLPTALALSNDASLVAVGTEHGNVHLYELADGFQYIDQYKAHEDKVNFIQISSDKTMVTSGGDDGLIHVWDYRSRGPRILLRGHESPVNSLSLSQNGVGLASGDDDGTIRIWQLEDGASRIFRGHTGSVTSVHLTGDSSRLFTAGRDGSVRLWNTLSGSCIRTFQGHSDPVASMAASMDDLSVFSGGEDKLLKMWRTSPFTSFRRVPLAVSQAESIETAEEKTRILRSALSSAEGAARSHNLPECLTVLQGLRRRAEFSSHPEAVEAWTSLYTKLPRRTLRGMWERGQMARKGDAVNSVRVSRDGRICFVVYASGAASLWDSRSARSIWSFGDRLSSVTDAAFTQDGRTLVVSKSDGTLEVYDCGNGKCLKSMNKAGESFEGIALSPDDRFVISIGWGIMLWDFATGEQVWTLEGHRTGLSAVAWGSSGRLLLTGGHAGMLKIWDIESRSCVKTIHDVHSSIRSVALSMDERTVVAASGSQWSSRGVLRVYDVATGKLRATLDEDCPVVSSVALTLDGKFAVTGRMSGSIDVWDLESCKSIKTLHRDWGAIESVCLSPDASILFCGCQDGSVHTWGLDWELEARDYVEWDDRVEDLLKSFLHRHRPYSYDTRKLRSKRSIGVAHALSRTGKPEWTQHELENFIQNLGYAGYGWISSHGIRKALSAYTKKLV